VTQIAHTDRFALVTAAHHFLLNVWPVRAPESFEALMAFVTAVRRVSGSSIDVDPILLRCLAVLDQQIGRRIPSLIDRYLANAEMHGPLARFRTCVDELLRDHCVEDRTVQLAIDIIRARFAEPSLHPREIAENVGASLSTLDVAFKREVGRTTAAYIRDVRLERATILLVTTNRTIKEIWADIGYNHPSNFNHDFKRCFGASPREFRGGSIRPIAQAHFHANTFPAPDQSDAPRSLGTVLLVDDDDCARWTLSVYLGREGFSVSAAASGGEGLRLATNASPDVILLDYRIGDMDGLAFLRRLHRAMPGKVPPVVLLTADWNVFDRYEEVQELGATVVSKLCDLGQLRQLTMNLAGRAGSASLSGLRRQPDASNREARPRVEG
jgi:AraC-like DNA-binding protein/CheY-like chemotaxis protein